MLNNNETATQRAERSRPVYIVNETDQSFDFQFDGLYSHVPAAAPAEEGKPRAVGYLITTVEKAWHWLGDQRLRAEGAKEWNKEVRRVFDRIGGPDSPTGQAIRNGLLYVLGWGKGVEAYKQPEQPREYAEMGQVGVIDLSQATLGVGGAGLGGRMTLEDIGRAQALQAGTVGQTSSTPEEVADETGKIKVRRGGSAGSTPAEIKAAW